MESPSIHGGSAEEKSSCESGWTMYIEDTFHSDVVYEDYDDDEGDGNDDDLRVKEVDDDGGGDGGDSSDNESDDSMTSDASSWPSTQLPRNTKNHAAEKNSNAKQVNHQTEIRACETFTDEGEESELKGRTRITAASGVPSKGKVNKTK